MTGDITCARPWRGLSVNMGILTAALRWMWLCAHFTDEDAEHREVVDLPVPHSY